MKTRRPGGALLCRVEALEMKSLRLEMELLRYKKWVYGPRADSAVPVDNNTSEREMKRIVLNRKNSLFAGSERGGRTAAILSSLTSTCRRHDIDPQRYLTQLLTNLPDTPVSKLDRWLPDEFKRRDPPPPAA